MSAEGRVTTKTARARVADGPRSRRQAQRLRPGDVRRARARLRRARARRRAARRRALRARRPLHRRARPRRSGRRCSPAGGWPIPDGAHRSARASRGRASRKPVVVAVQGICFTIGIELMLATDIRVAARDTRFGQIEVKRGIYPVGGATIRLPREVGWGNAMRWLLTGDEFDAAEALRIGLVQEVVEPGQQLRARRRARRARSRRRRRSACARRSPSSRLALARRGRGGARGCCPTCSRSWRATTRSEGLPSFLERRPARFTGR